MFLASAKGHLRIWKVVGCGECLKLLGTILLCARKPSFSSKLKGSTWIGLVLTPLESHRLGLKGFEYAETILYAHLPKNPVDMILHRLFGKI